MTRWRRAAVALALVVCACGQRQERGERSPGGDETRVGSSRGPGADLVDVFELPPNHLHPGSRFPVASPALRELSPRSIVPRGWLARTIQRLAPAVERLAAEASADGTSILASDCTAPGPASVRALGSYAWLLDDGTVPTAARDAIDRLLESGDADGWIGAPAAKTRLDWRAVAPLLDALADHHRVTGDARVIEVVARFARFLGLRLAESTDGRTAADAASLAPALIWLHDRTGDAAHIELARTLHRARDEPKTFAAIASSVVMGIALANVGADPGEGGTADDAFARLESLWRGSAGGPTCGLPDLAEALRSLGEWSADPRWFERLERLVLNDLPASHSADGRVIHDAVRPNQVEPPAASDPRCCGADLLRTWARFGASLWRAAPGDGLAALSYAPCEVTTLVGEDEGTVVTIRVETAYPFDETVEIHVSSPRPVVFPMTLRIPSWCHAAVATINDHDPIEADAGTWLGLARRWIDGDRVRLDLPARPAVTPAERNSIGVRLGPLDLVVPVQNAGDDWNRALVVDPFRPDRWLSAVRRRADTRTPFTLETPGVQVTGQSRLLPSWTRPDRLPQSPVIETRLDGPTEPVTLVPAGATPRRVGRLPWTAP